MPPSELRDELRQRRRPDAGLHADADRRLEVAPAPHRRPQLAELVVDLLDVAVDEAAERRQLILAGLALEERAAEFLLQMLDGARQRRLGDIAVRSGARKVAGARNRQEVSELVQLHGFPRNPGDALLCVRESGSRQGSEPRRRFTNR